MGAGGFSMLVAAPGILTVRIAHLFEEAVGLDPDPAMLAEGRRAAYERGITNICWVQAVAEDLPGAAPRPYGVVTFGQSFHWTDEARVAEAVCDMLEPGALALIVHTVEGRPAPPSPGHRRSRTQRSRRWWRSISDQPGAPARASRRFEPTASKTSLFAPGSVRPWAIFAPGIPDLLRDSESVLSGYFSMSSSAPHLFGDRVEDFASEVRALVRSRSPEGIFWDWPGDTEVILARKPG